MRQRGKPKHPHLTLVDNRTKRVTGMMHLVCRACGDEFSIVLPCSLFMAPAVMKQWGKEHGACLGWQQKARAELLGALLERARR